MNTLQPMSRESLHAAVAALCQEDCVLRALLIEFGQPPLWQRTQTFATLVHIILEQKVSLASANAVMQRVRVVCPTMTPGQFLDVPDQSLRDAGISGRKLSYCQSIAKTLQSGELDLASLRRCSDQGVIDQLTNIRGIGPWTAGVYLLMAMRRPDAWASGDRALVVSLAESAGFESVQTYEEFDTYASRWQPFRAAAARLLWHAYLCRRHR